MTEEQTKRARTITLLAEVLVELDRLRLNAEYLVQSVTETQQAMRQRLDDLQGCQMSFEDLPGE